ncbi:MAG: polysaccharide biosynthesis protein [Candidatus Cloacimonadota bacterium]|nr:MAG: polysaccharide biosynthesis protein [Candidatus Cloacimonadota bacterium]PIE77776.1 MAG: polysaccharide biosynthesis protein [Candidatus Delongbacteria bacterium]
MLNFISKIITRGSKRSIKAKRNILLSFGVKFISILIGFVYVPLILDYLDPVRYGIWLTLSSIVAWFGFFDVGLGNGLRNNFAEAIAVGNCRLAREYVSTTYAILGMISMVAVLIFLIVNPFLDWSSILNTEKSLGNELSLLAIITFICFLLRFVFKLIGQILLADQRTAISNTFGPIGNLINLLLIFLLTYICKGSLLVLGTLLSVTPVLVLFTASIYFFKKDYRMYAPSLEFVNFAHKSKLLSLGVKFFIIQISDIVLISSTNFILARLFNHESVTVYNIAMKYFSLFIMGFTVVLSPIWSAVTEAFVKGDFKWVKNTMFKLKLFGFVLLIFVVLALLLSNKFYLFWIGDSVEIPFVVSLSISIQTSIYLIFAPYVAFLNGVSKIKLSLIVVIFQTILYIPMAIYFGKFLNLGVSGVVFAGIISGLPLKIIQPIQYHKIINGKAEGIWNE